MLDRANQDAASGGYAELMGMAPQLTTPSRHHRELVDIWFEVEWTERDAEWDDAFKQLSNGRRPDPDAPSFFELFAHTCTSGLIAARQVSPDRSVWAKIEAEASALIGLVNAEVAQRRSPPAAPTSKPGRWSLRMRDASAFLASILWLGDEKPQLESVAKVPIHVSHGSSTAGR
jgi:hypothetical protein